MKYIQNIKLSVISFLMILIIILSACNGTQNPVNIVIKSQVIFDSDANNEVDDQCALAYLLFNGDHFDLAGVTVNATSTPAGFLEKSDVSDHYDEAKRVMQLCGNFYGKIPLKTGANGSFKEIKGQIGEPDFDGHEAVDFIIEQAMKKRDQKLILLAVGKLTNIALALKKEPAIANNVRIVWLGSNYPEPGEHNLLWDIESMNYILNQNIPFEIVSVRIGKASGTAAIMASRDYILHHMPGKGPEVETPVTGRHGGEFTNFGDYVANLFSQYAMWGNPPGRALFDMAAVAIIKNPEWAERREIPAPIYVDDKWKERPDNQRKVIIWEWFEIYSIMNDFIETMDNYKFVDVN